MFLPIDDIKVPSRQRSEIPRSTLIDLIDSIKADGLFHPILVHKAGGGNTHHLLAGERRLRAVKELHEKKHKILFGKETVPEGTIPVIVTNVDSRYKARKLELAENMFREALSWQDRTRALAELHELEKAIRPETTQADTAEILAKTAKKKPQTIQKEIAQATIINAYMEKPEVARARSQQEAYRIALDIRERKFAALLQARVSEASKDAQSKLAQLRLGDLTEILPRMDENQFDLILADPPYGYNAGTYFPNSVKTKHLYSDSPEDAMEIAKTILREGFRICKPKANLLMFCQPKMFGFLSDYASQMCWEPFPYPIIWNKLAPGSPPWGRLGFRRCYEFIFYATKGARGLVEVRDDILAYSKPSGAKKLHPAEKPIDLLKDLIKCTTLPGEYILDPCAGSASSLIAARELKRRALGIEKEEEYYLAGKARLLAQDSPPTT